jgi:hypothetical protein
MDHDGLTTVRLLWSTQVRKCVQNSQPLDHIPRQFTAVHIPYDTF